MTTRSYSATDRPGGRFVGEQQANYKEQDGQITWMRVLCSAFMPR